MPSSCRHAFTDIGEASVDATDLANTGAKSAITAPTPLPRCVRLRLRLVCLRDILLAAFFTEK